MGITINSNFYIGKITVGMVVGMSVLGD